MAHPDDTYMFNAIVAPLRPDFDTRQNNLELSARDPRVRAMSMYMLQYGYYDSMQAEDVMHEYGLAPWDIDAAIPLSLHTEDEKTALTIAKAAEDEYVRGIIYWLVVNDIDNELLMQDYYDELEKYVVDMYGLEPELSDKVFNLCENNIRERESQRGQA
jgi:hypothetical protein